jgi:probable phosphoglycerate mutase
MATLHILPPKPFYLVRHGQSEANLQRIAAGGRIDTPLTELGIAQAKELAAVIHHLPVKPSRIYHSPLQRAKHTADHINAALGLDMVEIDNLKEHIYGDWENVHWDAIKPLMAEGINPPNGETYNEFAARVRSAITQALTPPHSAPPMLVAHGGVFDSIGHLYGIKFGRIGNCALFYFEPVKNETTFPWTITILSPCPKNGLRGETFRS